jgi:hypothetical protein
VPNNLQVLTWSHGILIGLVILSVSLGEIIKMWVIFHTQKNGQHGKEKLFGRNPNPGGFCYVTSSYMSLLRFQRLRAIDPWLNPALMPLSVYWDPGSSTVKLINASDMETYMHMLASTVYNLHPIDDADALQKWGTHSLCVGACVILHAMGFSTLDIQWILHWRSTAFMAYLQNIVIHSVQQYAVLDKALALPFI